MVMTVMVRMMVMIGMMMVMVVMGPLPSSLV